MKGKLFAQYHSSVIFLYFCGVIGLTMFAHNPYFILISFAIASVTAVYLKGMRSYLKGMAANLIVFLAITVMNPLFNGRGMTVIFYLYEGKPITWESLLYGITSGGMFVAVFVWFSCYNVIMTSDKFIALFGRFVPVIAMMISMVMQYIPATMRRAKEIEASQRALLGGEKPKLSHTLRQYTILLSWGFESSIETADSMKGRGYGESDCKGKRTNYTNERLSKKDIIVLVLLIVFITISVFTAIKAGAFEFFPFIESPQISKFEYLAFALLALLPILIEVKEMIRCLLYRL